MELTTQTLDLAKDKKFTEFSKAVKTELKKKLKNKPEIKQYISDYDKIQQMKAKFAEISHMDSDT